MKSRNFIIILLFFSLPAFGQEVLLPLSSGQHHALPKSNDTLRLELPFFDDFSNYDGLPDTKRWLTYDAFVNKDYAPEPPTVGMVTLDALNANGDLYPHASTNVFTADTLASQIVRLDSLTGVSRRKIQPSDSVILSFYYLPGGWYGNMWERVGDSPSEQDSLFLELYSSIDSCWVVAWATGGFDADTSRLASRWPWKYVSVKIDDIRFFTDRFQFRFRNYASLDVNPKNGIAGNCDHWNIDYIYLNYNRTVADSIFRDVAFVEKAPSMLANYRAMPALQFQPSDMASALEMKMVNRYNQTLASNYSYTVYNAADQEIGSYSGGYENIAPFFPTGHYQDMTVHSAPPVNFSFPAMTSPTEYRVVHVLREGVGGDNHTCNDTIEFRQVFSNYYAYDDGVPENGYGLTATGNRVWLAVRFDMNTEDTLTAFDMFFNRTRGGENEDIRFQLCVWDCHNGKPGTLLYKDEAKLNPEFEGFNKFHRYALSQPLVVEDSLFIGFEQLSTDFINLGFDRSNDSRERIYYRAGNEWMQSILRGSVMMRPVFGSAALTSFDEIQPLTLSVYPNPANDILFINITDDSETLWMTLYDMQGRIVRRCPYTHSLSTAELPCGLYLLRINDSNNGRQTTTKIIISR